MKIITVETLKTFLDELNKKYGTEFYSKAESDERYQPKGESRGGDVDYAELARRIPSWQWKVTMPKTVNQTVTATVGSRTYTSDFYAQQGSKVTFGAKANQGYIAGSLSTANTTLSKDLTVTITAAAEKEDIEAGTKTFGEGTETFTVPPKVHVLKWTWAGKDAYTKVASGKEFKITTSKNSDYDENFQRIYFYRILEFLGGEIIFNGNSYSPLAAAWSNEINEHAFDQDWTK